jgi:hypothetical protein
MNDLLPKMIVQKKAKEPEIPEVIPKEKIEQNQVFEDKTTKKKNKKVIIKDEGQTEEKEIEDEIKELENEIEEAETNEEEEPEQHPHFEEPIQEQEPPIIQPIKEEQKIDKRKGKPSQARLEHLARIREKAAETRRKKAEEKNKQKENPTPPPQPIYNHNITADQISFAINNALEIQEKKRLERKEIKKKKKEEEAVILKKQKEEEEVKKKVMNAVNIPRQGEWDFCFR